MSKRPVPPPPGDKPVPAAPPPPAWRHWLWPAAIIVTVLLYVILPGLHTGKQVTLSYSQFINDASAHKIKDVTFASAAAGSNTPATGTLTSGQAYTTVIPGNPTPGLSAQLTADGVKNVTAVQQGQSFASELFYLLILVLPFIAVFYLFRRMSRGAGSTM